VALTASLQEIEALERKAAVLEDIFQNTATASVKGLSGAVKTEKGEGTRAGLDVAGI
jgi:hypothetical protein